ncbi:hypothetical protein PRIPAC_74058 [Pristionchus pacificus]|uniref:Uncharacterized protein n=1 Tax=Pristionchus pacificus TaxID=54126 RepID=A0A2A6C8T1_PRIPA|nr:hypothetical protein PRIPAC_74058 [Pristionchus pacificus]|eukprot:PDM74431.1 hypothetical protein PRIPAC_41787 [Pristionchus pacificus]
MISLPIAPIPVPVPAPPVAAGQPIAPVVVAPADPLGGFLSGVSNVMSQAANGFTQFLNALAALARSSAPIVGPLLQALVAGENVAAAAASVAIPVALSVVNSGFYGGRHGYYGGGFGFGPFGIG